MNAKTIFIIAGESSGDSRAAEVLHELRQLDPSLSFEGLGGPHMKAAGVRILEDLTALAVVGITDVLKKYFIFRRLFYQALEHVKKIRPAAVVLVDYPGFNLRFARKVKRLGIPVLYYVSPQVWAWANWRIKKLPALIDKLFVILPFEVDIYKHTSLAVEFVGHPLVDTFAPSPDSADIRTALKVIGKKPVITILAGSREAEVKKIFPVLVQAACHLTRDFPTAHFLISQAPHIPSSLYTHMLAPHQLSYTLTSRTIHDLITVADFCWVTSGTATLETALGMRPFIITYKTSWLTYILAKHLITIPYIGLANIIAGKKIVPEFLQNDAHPETIAHETKYILTNPQAYDTIVKELTRIKKLLGPPGAARRTAEGIYSFLTNRSR